MPPVPRPLFRAFVFAALPLAAVALGGSTTRWSEGIVLGAVGLMLLAAPPRTSLGWKLNAILAGLVALAATAFLPAAWFHAPVWRTALTDRLGTALPATLSPQPWLAAECLGLFLGGIGWFYLMSTAAWTGEERARAGRWFAGGVVALAAVFIAYYRAHAAPGYWHNERGFGPFPNRNQTADLLAVGALPTLACAHGAWRGGRRVAAGGWLVGWAVVAAALFDNYSRAGIGILFVGTAAYLGNEIVRAFRKGRGKTAPVRGSGKTAALAVSLVLLLASGFMLFGGDTLERLRPGSRDVATLTTEGDFRVRIQRDALDMIADSPWCGVGLGSFEPVFAAYRRRSAAELHTVHPESDWLWMTAELGWPAGVLAAAGVVLLVRRAWPRRSGSERPLRTAAAIGVVAFALHALVDVSAHRVGTAWCALFLLGLALPGPGDEKTDFRRPASWAPWGFRLLGLFLAGIGVLWLLADRGKVRVPGEQEVARLMALTRTESEGRRWAESVATASRGLALDPVNWQLYFQRAVARLGAREVHAAAEADFRRALYLEPFLGNAANAVAVTWARAGEPDLAVGALIEACRRTPADAPNYFTGVCEAAGNDPAFLTRLEAATRSDPALHLLYIEQLPAAFHRQAVMATLAADPDLNGYTDRQRARLFRSWREDDAGLAAAMEAHPAWQRAGWRRWANALAGLDAVDRACKIAARFAPRPVVPPEAPGADRRSIAELQAAALRSPGDLTVALQLYRARLAAGDASGAATALHAVTTRPGCPAYFYYLEANAATDAGRWPTAWEAWQRYLDAVPENG